MLFEVRAEPFAQLSGAVAVDDAQCLCVTEQRIVDEPRHAGCRLVDGAADDVELGAAPARPLGEAYVHTYLGFTFPLTFPLTCRPEIAGPRLDALAHDFELDVVPFDGADDAFEAESAGPDAVADGWDVALRYFGLRLDAQAFDSALHALARFRAQAPEIAGRDARAVGQPAWAGCTGRAPLLLRLGLQRAGFLLEPRDRALDLFARVAHALLNRGVDTAPQLHLAIAQRVFARAQLLPFGGCVLALLRRQPAIVVERLHVALDA